jgi:hypothetical protein
MLTLKIDQIYSDVAVKPKWQVRKPYKIDDAAFIQSVQRNPDHYLKEMTDSFG